MPEWPRRILAVVLLAAASGYVSCALPGWIGGGLPGEFPVLAPILAVFALLGLASALHERFKHRR